jgi:hypothetical protein
MQYENGDETMELGGVQAQNQFNASQQRKNLRDSFECHFARFPGQPIPNSTRGKSTRPYDRIVKFVEINVDGDAPNGGNLVAQLVVDGVLLAEQYGVLQGAQYAYRTVTGDGNGGPNPFADAPHDPLSGPGVLVPAGQTLEVRLTAVNNAEDVTVTLIQRRRIL